MRETQEAPPTGIAPTIRARITEAGDHFWRPEDFDDLANPNAVDQALADLHTAGELRRIRRGLYWRGRRTAFGMTPPPATDIIEQITGLTYGIGPSGYSAALGSGSPPRSPASRRSPCRSAPQRGCPRGSRSSLARRDAAASTPSCAHRRWPGWRSPAAGTTTSAIQPRPTTGSAPRSTPEPSGPTAWQRPHEPSRPQRDGSSHRCCGPRTGNTTPVESLSAPQRSPRRAEVVREVSGRPTPTSGWVR